MSWNLPNSLKGVALSTQLDKVCSGDQICWSNWSKLTQNVAKAYTQVIKQRNRHIFHFKYSKMSLSKKNLYFSDFFSIFFFTGPHLSFTLGANWAKTELRGINQWLNSEIATFCILSRKKWVGATAKKCIFREFNTNLFNWMTSKPHIGS